MRVTSIRLVGRVKVTTIERRRAPPPPPPPPPRIPRVYTLPYPLKVIS